MAESTAPRVLVAAYACHPDQGSEPGAGWQWLAAIAMNHRVTLLTGVDVDDRLEREIDRLGLPVDVVRVGTPADVIHIDSRWRHLRYGAWVWCAARRAAAVERRGGVAVAHHLTYASDWLPTPLTRLRRTPIVWGPVGGATYPHRGLVLGLPVRSRLFEWARRTVSSISRRTLAAGSIHRTALIVALNRDTADVFAGRRVVVEPNAALDHALLPEPADPPERGAGRRAVYAGRLVAWKGLALALAALADHRAANWHLDVFGSGPERTNLDAQARRLGVADRVRFHGVVARPTVLAAMTGADAFVFPSLHDSAPWAVAEAAALGVPVLCFDAGAAPTLAGPCARLLDTASPVASIASRLAEVAAARPPRTPHRAFSRDRLPEVVDSWYAAVTRPPAMVPDRQGTDST
ncbi:MAG: glycosyltransferase [Pseudonocardia sp.]